MKISSKDRLIVALDFDRQDKALKLVDKLKNDVRFFKVGLELFTSAGPGIIEEINQKDCRVFLDLKLHDIPNTVTKAALSVLKQKPFILNVHALGGYEMMKNASDAVKAEAAKTGIDRPWLIGVTILTSLDEKALKRVGINDNIRDEVLRLSRLCREAGMDGVVASSSEAKFIREEMGRDFLIVTPGIRPEHAALNDQKRIATPKSAVHAGADFIVVGRPITEANDPVAAAREIIEEMGS